MNNIIIKKKLHKGGTKQHGCYGNRGEKLNNREYNNKNMKGRIREN